MADRKPVKLGLTVGGFHLDFEGTDDVLQAEVPRLVQVIEKLQVSRVSVSLDALQRTVEELKQAETGAGEVLGELKKDVDSMTELGEMEALRLQMAMDRLSKMMSTLSNLLKSLSDTAQSITQNLK